MEEMFLVSKSELEPVCYLVTKSVTDIIAFARRGLSQNLISKKELRETVKNDCNNE